MKTTEFSPSINENPFIMIKTPPYIAKQLLLSNIAGIFIKKRVFSSKKLENNLDT